MMTGSYVWTMYSFYFMFEYGTVDIVLKWMVFEFDFKMSHMCIHNVYINSYNEGLLWTKMRLASTASFTVMMRVSTQRCESCELKLINTRLLIQSLAPAAGRS